VKNAVFQTKTNPGAEDTEPVTIISRASNGFNFTNTTLYSGPCDFQPANGSTFTDPGGVVQIADAFLVIDPDPVSGALPAVQIVDDGPRIVAQVNGLEYDVLLATPWTFPPAHLELTLKRGPQTYRGK
jgi:hypothetical protein